MSIVMDVGGAGGGKSSGEQQQEFRLVIRSGSQECAVVDVVGGAPGEGMVAGLPKVGECVRVLPIHSCMTAMQHPVVYAWEERAEDGEAVLVGEYVPCKFWR